MLFFIDTCCVVYYGYLRNIGTLVAIHSHRMFMRVFFGTAANPPRLQGSPFTPARPVTQASLRPLEGFRTRCTPMCSTTSQWVFLLESYRNTNGSTITLSHWVNWVNTAKLGTFRDDGGLQIVLFVSVMHTISLDSWSGMFFWWRNPKKLKV